MSARLQVAAGAVRRDRASARTAAQLLIALSIVFGGCAQQPAKRSDPAPLNLSGYSPAFKEGFQHGCDSARGSPKRDVKRSESDAQYAQGWQDGRAICGER